jgi:alpha-galactosidase
MDIKQSYQAMSTALNSTGRRIHFNMCEWGKESPWEWGNSMAQVTRAAAQQTSATSALHIVLDGQESLVYMHKYICIQMI